MKPGRAAGKFGKSARNETLFAEPGRNGIRQTIQEPWDTEVVGWQGLEPWTNALKGHCSTN